MKLLKFIIETEWPRRNVSPGWQIVVGCAIVLLMLAAAAAYVIWRERLL